MTRHHLLPEQRVTLVTLGVRDLDRAKTFYRALGWHPAREAEGVAFYQMHGGWALSLYALADLADDLDRPQGELGTGAMTLAQNFGTEEDVDTAYHRAVGAGARAVKAPQATAWGGYAGYFADPDGHLWELAHNPFWPLAEDGGLTLPAG
jgi:catechol 2,3-dioxygenase-like lactoylglutathione lyase family enzyme